MTESEHQADVRCGIRLIVMLCFLIFAAAVINSFCMTLELRGIHQTIKAQKEE